MSKLIACKLRSEEIYLVCKNYSASQITGVRDTGNFWAPGVPDAGESFQTLITPQKYFPKYKTSHYSLIGPGGTVWWKKTSKNLVLQPRLTNFCIFKNNCLCKKCKTLFQDILLQDISTKVPMLPENNSKAPNTFTRQCCQILLPQVFFI